MPGVTAPWRLLVLAGLALALLFAGLGATALTDRDEGANAEAAREMLEQRAWITPTLGYTPRFAKPAFVYWLMAAAYGLLGVSEAAARLPSALAVLALVGLQYAFARWALGPAAAFRAALILLLTVEVVAIGRLALTDGALVLCTTAAAFAFFRAHHGPPPRDGWYLLMYTAMALGTLTKGPVGLLVPAVGITGYLVAAGDGRRVWREARPLRGLALFLLLASPWYAAMLWQHGGDYLARAKGETVGRVFRVVTGPGGTALFYVPVVLLGFFPWSAFLPGALLGALRGARAREPRDRAGQAAVFAAAWIVAVLCLFSLFASRLPHYVAPAFPAAALLVAAAWPRRVPGTARWLLGGLGVVVGAGLIAAGLLRRTVTALLAPAYPVSPVAALSPVVLGLGAVALGAGAAAGLRDGTRLFVVLTVLTTLLVTLGLHVVFPAFSAEFVAPAGSLVARAAPAIGPCDELVAFGPYRPSLLFYARRPVSFVGLREASRLAGLAARPGRLFVVAPRGALAALPPAVAALPVLDARGGYVLLASAAAGGPCP